MLSKSIVLLCTVIVGLNSWFAEADNQPIEDEALQQASQFAAKQTSSGHVSSPQKSITRSLAGVHDSLPMRRNSEVVNSAWASGPYVSVQINVDDNGMNIMGDAANAPCLVRHPNEPNKIVVGWRQFDSAQSNFREAGWGYSLDNGVNWTFPGVIQNGTFRSQPVLGANTQGRLLYLSLGSPSRLSSSFTGLSWSAGFAAPASDKSWMAVDRTGGIGTDNVYVVWNGFFARDNNNGGNFETLNTPGHVQLFPSVSVAHDGSVYVAARSECSYVRVSRSTNAQDFSQPPVFTSTIFELGGSTLNYAGPNPGGFLGQIWVATDHSVGSSTSENVYVLSSLDPPGVDPLDVMFARSTDNGKTWSTPVRVNDDPASENAWEWFGNMSVAPNGRIDVIWNDTRDQESVNISRLYYSSSGDGGRHWSPSIPISPSFDSFVGWPLDDHKLGDYYHLISNTCTTDIVYAATFNGEQDVYYLRVNADCNSNGIADCDEVSANPVLDCNQNLMPDECELDCNANGASDACELLNGAGVDCNANLVLDECEGGCNGNGSPDDCDIDTGVSLDCQPDGVPDECQKDCNGNGKPDDCDIADNFSTDNDQNSVPDDCQRTSCQLSRLLPPDISEFDLLGYDVALTEDFAIVAAVGDSEFGPHSGAVYVFKRQATEWLEVQKLLTPLQMEDDTFGHEVSVFGETLAVSMLGDLSVQMYHYDGEQWMWQARVTSNDPQQQSGFSDAISLYSDSLAVSAPNDFTAGSGTGAVYVFQRNGTDWTQSARLTIPETEFQHTSGFGSSLVHDGNTLVVGAPGHSCPAQSGGSVLVYRKFEDSWTFSQRLHADVPGVNASFGHSIALEGNWLVVGSPGAAFSGAGQYGAAYVFRRQTDTWTLFESLAPDPDVTRFFGTSVNIEGDRIVIGADGDNDAGPNSGAVYVYRFDGIHWSLDGKIVMPDPTNNDYFGGAVAINGGTLLVGAVSNDSVAMNNGSAYVFSIGGDCNGDQIADGCNIESLTSADCNDNMNPDECEALPPDGDFDGDVDLWDYSLLFACITGPEQEIGQTCCSIFDQPIDQHIDLLDFAILQNAFNGS